MRPSFFFAAAALLGVSAAASSASSSTATSSTATSTTSSAAVSTCSGNSASTRTEWCDYDISTDYYNDGPDTGVTKEYWFELTDVTVSPDGISRSAMAVNGSIPGPTIFADWGDTVKVHVTNSLTTSGNGSSVHWHGIRQNYTNQNDGVVSIVQCPIAPGESYTYEWKATQYGSSWYHSHIGLQAWEGIFGGIVINGPATANYDEDLGMLFLNDWSHSTVDELYTQAQSSGPPTLENGLINGTNTYTDDDDTTTGSRFEVSMTSGTSYRLRLVNAGIDTHFKFMIDNHTLTVIANDLVPIEPYTTTVLDIAMGQRYDIIVTADQASVASDFWLRAIPQEACSDNANADDIKGIVHYGTSTSTPDTTAYSYTDACVDEDVSSLIPYVSKTATSGTSLAEAITVGSNSDNLFRWYMNATSMVVEWANPTLLQVYNDNLTFTSTSGVVQLDAANSWYFFVIETDNAVPHPIHLHGHDFFILAQGTGDYDDDTTLNLDNPPRRDTAMLDSSGYLVIAFETDNPGAWLMHCHIGWHTSEGFALQILERYTEVQEGLIDYGTLSETCEAWTTYAEEEAVESDDSGV